MTQDFFRTQNRALEQFLFVHVVKFHHMERAQDGMTVWCYENNETLRGLLDEWKIILRRRQKLCGA